MDILTIILHVENPVKLNCAPGPSISPSVCLGGYLGSFPTLSPNTQDSQLLRTALGSLSVSPLSPLCHHILPPPPLTWHDG